MFDTARHLCSLLTTQEREEVHLQKGLPWVVTDLASQAVTYCSADLLTDCLQLCRSTYLASDVLRQCQTEDYSVSIQRAAGGRQGTAGKDPFMEWVFDDYFQEDGLVMESSQVLASLYHYTVASVPAHSVHDDKSTLQQLASAVTPVISHLKDNGHLSLAVQYCQETVTTMMQRVTSQAMGFTDLSPPVKQQQTIDMELLKTIVPPSLTEISLMTSSLLMKVLSHWPVDHALVVGLLCNLPHKLALEILQKATKKLGFHYKHILAVVRAGKDFADMCREQKTYDAYQLLEMDAYWGHKLAKCKVSFKGVFGLSRIEKRQLLPQICRSRTVHATSIRQFCSDYALDEDEPLMMHLKHLLGQCAVVSSGGTAMQAIDHALVTSLLSAATELIEDFHNTELLLWSLQKILPQIDPYDYTRLEFVLKHMSNISSDPSVKKHQKLLSFLCEYKRVAPPSSYELNYNTGDTKMVIENRALPAVADTRLPFHPLASGAPWKIICESFSCCSMLFF
ncbi:hypothetical protein LSAT2_025557 [Lamellibrachia satsuma]|nr:hypothetical protein LSAT2_025557 [Lamellibrachia satsuma]